MEDEDDSYGFGSYAQLFASSEAAAAGPALALDASAARQFWMPERLLQTLTEDGGDSQTGKQFRHVVARLDGRVVDGGLGRASLARPQGGRISGVLWLQTTRADNNAQQQRRQQLGDDARSPAALFVPLADVVNVQAAAIQGGAVQSVELALTGGHSLHLAFLPGPFFRASHRDEFLGMLNQQLEAQRRAGGAQVEASKADSTRLKSPQDSEKPPVRAEADTDAESTRRDASQQAAASKEAMRALVRRYSTLDELSDDAIQLARQVHEATGYHLGPLAKKFPRFSADATHRKQSVQHLSKVLTEMNAEWTRADAHRELHTNTKVFRNQDELFQYTDAGTGEGVSPRSYETRYAQYAGLEDRDPVIRRVAVKEVAGDRVAAIDAYKAKLSALLRVDVSTSCVVDEAFFKDDPADGELQEDPEPEAAAARKTLWQRWGAAFSDYMKQRDAIAGASAALQVHTAASQGGGGSAGMASQPTASGARKRPRDRRRSILPPSEVVCLDELESAQSSSAKDPSSGHGKRRRRSSSSSLEPPTGRASDKRQARRQSITGAVDMALLVAHESTERRQSSNKDESKSKSQEEGEDPCPLCFDEPADVEMEPCGHRVCGSCWKRLADDGQRSCPWDREPVSKR